MTKSGKALKEQYQMEALAQWKGKPLSSPVAADITLFFGTQRAADWDNFRKLSCDALLGIAYEDDKQIKRAVVAHRTHSKRAMRRPGDSFKMNQMRGTPAHAPLRRKCSECVKLMPVNWSHHICRAP